jgi:hypothetical protein
METNTDRKKDVSSPFFVIYIQRLMTQDYSREIFLKIPKHIWIRCSQKKDRQIDKKALSIQQNNFVIFFRHYKSAEYLQNGWTLLAFLIVW